MPKFELKNIRGVIPAMLTPFDAEENLDLDTTRKLVDKLCESEIGGLYLTGSTGEGFLMSADERKSVVETVIEQVDERVPVIVHVGAMSTLEAEELARHAGAVGAAAVSSVPPLYWQFSDSEIKDYYQDLVTAAGIPMIVYNIALAGLVSFEMIRELASIEGVQGIKYTSSSLYDVFRIKEAIGEDFMVYSGSDELAISGLSFGADGIIGSTYNLLSPLFVRIWNAMKNDRVREASQLQKQANRFIFTFLKHNLNPTLKYLQRYQGLEGMCSRRPFALLSEGEKKAIDLDFLKLNDEIGDCDLPFMRGLINEYNT